MFLVSDGIRLRCGERVGIPAGSSCSRSLICCFSSAAQQDDDVDEEQADQDEGEVDEQLLQVPLGLRVHLDLRRPADGRLGHVLDALHGDGLDLGWLVDHGLV